MWNWKLLGVSRRQINILISCLSFDYHPQQEKVEFNPSQKENDRYAACPAPQEFKDRDTGFVDQVGKFHGRFK